MIVTIDKAGRLVIPKVLREQLGIQAGEVKISVDGVALRIEAVTEETLKEEGEWLVIPRSGEEITAELIRDLRDADQR